MLLVAALVRARAAGVASPTWRFRAARAAGPGSYTVYVQMPDTLAINGNSKVMVADVFVGSVRAIKMKNWVATLTLGLNKSVKLPKNALAKIGQTSSAGFSARGAGSRRRTRRRSR